MVKLILEKDQPSIGEENEWEDRLVGSAIRLGADAISRQAESLAERGLEGQVSSTRYRKIQDSSAVA